MKQIHKCPELFSNQCPKYWLALEPTEDEQRRHCSACDNTVYQCRTPDEFVSLGSNGQCVALPSHVYERLRREAGFGFFGQMGLPSKVGLEKMRDDLELREAWLNAIERLHGGAT